MVPNPRDSEKGYTIVELMVTIVIVSLLTAVLGTFVVKLLTLQEMDREEAYVREKLVDICGFYADFLSVGSSFGTNRFQMAVKYRQEAGGISFETGRISRVVHMISSVTNDLFVSDVHVAKSEGGLFSRNLNQISGDGWLRNVMASNLTFSISPIGSIEPPKLEEDSSLPGLLVTDAALGCLRVSAQYASEDERGRLAMKTVAVERVVRLWNGN